MLMSSDEKNITCVASRTVNSGRHYKNYHKVVLQAMPGKLTCKSKFA